MEPPDQSSAYLVQPGAQAAGLHHPMRPRLLFACARLERSLTELAGELAQPLPMLHYHVRRLVGCGLMQVSRVEPRAGRPVRYYRAVAEAFLVSLADIDEHLGEKLARELRQSLGEEANRRELSLLYYLDPAGQMRVRLVDPEGRGRTSRAFEHWKVLRLTPEQRVALAGELTALIARYESATADGKGEAFLVHAAFAPKP
jgi:hypothetical protein